MFNDQVLIDKYVFSTFKYWAILTGRSPAILDMLMMDPKNDQRIKDIGLKCQNTD